MCSEQELELQSPFCKSGSCGMNKLRSALLIGMTCTIARRIHAKGLPSLLVCTGFAVCTSHKLHILGECSARRGSTRWRSQHSEGRRLSRQVAKPA